MTRYIVPTIESVQQILSVMYGDDLEVSDAEEDCTADGHAATYIGDEDQLVAVCACDPEFVIFSGAALTMVPADVAREMISERDFSDIVLENFHEVMNILSRLLMSNSSPHLRLEKTLPAADAETALNGVAAEMSVAGFNVSIPAYGSGQLMFKVS